MDAQREGHAECEALLRATVMAVKKALSQNKVVQSSPKKGPPPLALKQRSRAAEAGHDREAPMMELRPFHSELGSPIEP